MQLNFLDTLLPQRNADNCCSIRCKQRKQLHYLFFSFPKMWGVEEKALRLVYILQKFHKWFWHRNLKICFNIRVCAFFDSFVIYPASLFLYQIRSRITSLVSIFNKQTNINRDFNMSVVIFLIGVIVKKWKAKLIISRLCPRRWFSRICWPAFSGHRSILHGDLLKKEASVLS